MRRKITWKTPREKGYAAAQWRAIQQEFFLPASICRVTITSLLVFAVLAVVFKAKFPLLELDSLWIGLIAIPSFYGMVLFTAAIMIVMPCYVEVRPDRVWIVADNVSQKIAASSIRTTRLIIARPDRIRLRILYMHKATRRSIAVAVPSVIDLEKLREMLPVTPRVRYVPSRAAAG